MCILALTRSPFIPRSSLGHHAVSAQRQLHPASALQGSRLQRRLSQRNLSPHPGAAGSAAALYLASGCRRCHHRGSGRQIRFAVARRRYWVRQRGLENHPAAFQPRRCLLRQVKKAERIRKAIVMASKWVFVRVVTQLGAFVCPRSFGLDARLLCV